MTEGPDLRDIGPDDPPPPSLMCRLCNGVLTPTSLWDPVTGAGTHRWVHPPGQVYDHEPDPVPTDHAVARQICDFCTAPESIGYALAVPFTTTYIGITTRDSGSWSCCPTCKNLLDTDPPALIDRCVALMVDRHGQYAAEPTRQLQEAFLAHYTGDFNHRSDRHTP